MSQAKKVNAEFAEKIEKTVAQKHIESRKRQRGEIDESRNQIDTENLTKKYKQHRVLATQHGENEARVFDSKVLGKMMKKKKQ